MKISKTRAQHISKAVCCADSNNLNWMAQGGNLTSLIYITGYFHALGLGTPSEKELESFIIQLKEI